MAAIIRVNQLSKRYRLGVIGAGSLREELAAFGQRLTGRGAPKPTSKDFWALRDVSFEVEPGEVIGIIGRNGAGKSTLLKILSRITEPTRGEAMLHGRMASLLEVGTGFHPELSGRDNIFLSGAIMGLKRHQIRERFDQIVQFAEIEQFIDTPVKRYSSGMYVRLGFAIAAHLEPEILIIDEVLAVGDQRFQQRCLGKMREVSSQDGRTVIFVSHNLGMVQNLCHRCIHLSEGQVIADGDSTQVVQKYLSHSKLEMSKPIAERQDRIGSGAIVFTHARLLNEHGDTIETCVSGQPCCIELQYERTKDTPVADVDFGIAIKADSNEYLIMYRSQFEGLRFDINERTGTVRCTINELPLCAGSYQCEIFMCDRIGFVYDLIASAFQLDVLVGDFFGTGNPGSPKQCKVLNRSKWETTYMR